MEMIFDETVSDQKSAVDDDFQLLLRASTHAQAPILRCWVNRPCLVVGKQVTRWCGYEAAKAAMQHKGWPVIERATGGTIVPHYSGVLNVSYIYPVLSANKSYQVAYEALCDPLISALGSLGVSASTGSVPGAYCDGEYNVIANGCKLAGTAQRWKQLKDQRSDKASVVLVHASLNVSDFQVGVAAVAQFLALCGDRAEAAKFTESVHTDVCTVTGKRELDMRAVAGKITESFSQFHLVE